MYWRFFFAAALITLLLVNISLSFEIAIYNDPLSYWNSRYLDAHRHGTYTGDYGDFLDSVYNDSQMESVYEWYRNMGVTKVMVNYIDPDNFNRIPQDSSDLKVLNWYMPGLRDMHGGKYADAQYREVHVGEVDVQFWSSDTSIGESATRTTLQRLNEDDELESRPVVEMGPDYISDDPDTMWQPESYLGNFSGWDWYTTGWLDSSFYMPLHYRITWAVDPESTVTTSTEFADFYWIVKIPTDRVQGYARWWRFPVKTLKLNGPNGLADTTNWITSNFYEDAQSGTYMLLDANFDTLSPVLWEDVYSPPSTVPRGLDENVLWNQIAYGRSEVRMCVYYRGTHSLYLNRIEVFDDAYWRMFVSGDSSAYQDTLWKAFRDEYNHPSGKSGGWYYDEWETWGEPLRAIVKVNKLLQTHGLPTFFINGRPSLGSDLDYNGAPYDHRNEFQYLLSQNNVQMSAHMDEFYPFAGDSGCTPDNAGEWPTEYMYTSTSSDVPYLDIRYAPGDCPDSDPDQSGCDGCPWHPYEGVQSLQCAIDGYMDPNANAQYVYDTLGCTLHCPGDYPFTSRAEQVRFVHDNDNQKFWALIQGSADWGNDATYRFKLRTPTPNEVKLVAWLAVACNVDGIMWYNWDFGGLIEYSTTSDAFEQTERYEAARDFGQDIGRISPIIEGTLEFVRTYASRAFETGYPDDGNEATQLDTLATNCLWHGQNYRAMYGISAFAPSGGGWSETPESHPYVQVSRFRNRLFEVNDPDREDYWFLVINRRALSTEARKIRLAVETDTTYRNNPYYVDYILGDSTMLLEPDLSRDYATDTRYLDVELQPGEAELVHFYRHELGCEEAQQLEVSELTIYRAGQDVWRLRWNGVQGADEYYICASMTLDSSWTAVGYTTDTTYVDSTSGFRNLPKSFYGVQACWEE